MVVGHPDLPAGPRGRPARGDVAAEADERSAAAGVTTVARTAASALAPGVTGALLGMSLLAAPFVVSGALKIVYDLLLYRSFRSVKPPEETAHEAARTA